MKLWELLVFGAAASVVSIVALVWVVVFTLRMLGVME